MIKIQNFTGELPRVSPRALGEAAQTNKNLLTTSAEFRPLQADSTVASGTNNAVTLYRFNRDAAGALLASDSDGWITSTTDKNHVKGQINDDNTERTYVTTNDGSALPRAIDATGQDRIMGVPKPHNAPGAVVNVIYEFSTENALAADTTVTTEIADAIKAAMVEYHYGNGIAPAAPNSTTIGWLQHGTAVTGTLPSASLNQWNLCIPVVGGNLPTALSFTKDPSYGGMQITYSAVVYWAIAIDLYASIWLPNSTALSAGLTALKDPSDSTGATGLFAPAEVTEVVSACMAYWGVTSEPLKSTIDAATAATIRLRDVIDSIDVPASYSTAAYDTALATFKGPNYASAAEAFKRIFWESVEYATIPGVGLAATPSRYWIQYGEATCYSNLSADMATCITTDATGFHTFNYSKFSDILRADFTILINQHATDKQALLDALGANLDYCLLPYREFFSAANLKALGGVQKTDAARMLAFNGAIANADAALTQLSNLGALLLSQRDTAAKNAYKLAPQARVSSAGVQRIVETRSYICTYVSDWDEESAPSAPSELVELDQNDTVTITCPKPPAGRNIAAIRLYRSKSGSTQDQFQFLAQMDNATQAYLTAYPDVQVAFDANDYGLSLQNFVATHYRKFGYIEQRVSPQTLMASPTGYTHWDTPANLQFKDQTLSKDLGEVCPSTGPDGMAHWDEPPTRLNNNGELSTKANPYLRGLVGMPNGIMAGFVDNFVAFCDPYHPYAWPLAYQIPLKFPITGLGVFGQTLFVGTIANPSFISGSDSASMSEQMLPDSQACVSAKSIAPAQGGVLYASPDGICYASPNGVEVITTALFSREDWQALTPSSIKAVMHEGVYYFTYSGTYGGVTGGCLVLDSVAKKLGRVDITATAMFTDNITDAVFYVSGTSIKKAFATGRRTGTWKSSKVVLPAPASFAWLQVDGDQSVGTPVTVRWYGDGVLRYTATVTNIAPVRLPSGRYIEHEIEIESAARITKVLLAESTQELKSA